MASSPSKQKASAQEKLAAETAVKDLKRHEKAFRPIEQAAIKELTNADAGARSEMLSSRSNADLEAASAAAKEKGFRQLTEKTGASGAARMSLANNAALTSEEKTGLRIAADQGARDSIDADTLNVIKTGRDTARGAQSGLTQAARVANKNASSKLQAQATKDAAKAEAIGGVVGAGAARGYVEYDRATARKGAKLGPDQFGPPQGFRVPDEELSGFGTFLRKRLT
ncbi:hypothetical protein [Kineobactrum salinum]|uniref:Uncharacterized protein n=1 Tax=Kineobactrum salinum TaxID=2708301 RepID=A0A6C0U4T7_9GAMM|nr:hypothetical protein [Kineobactrum salinum]QIB67170.1 hypothetical protein G3T16_18940 [Kineobactrum salinum]